MCSEPRQSPTNALVCSARATEQNQTMSCVILREDNLLCFCSECLRELFWRPLVLRSRLIFECKRLRTPHTNNEMHSIGSAPIFSPRCLNVPTEGPPVSTRRPPAPLPTTLPRSADCGFACQHTAPPPRSLLLLAKSNYLIRFVTCVPLGNRFLVHFALIMQGLRPWQGYTNPAVNPFDTELL